MFENLNWAVIYNGRVRALFVARWQAEKFIETHRNKEGWSIKYVPDDTLRNTLKGGV